MGTEHPSPCLGRRRGKHSINGPCPRCSGCLSMILSPSPSPDCRALLGFYPYISVHLSFLSSFPINSHPRAPTSLMCLCFLHLGRASSTWTRTVSICRSPGGQDARCLQHCVQHLGKQLAGPGVGFGGLGLSACGSVQTMKCSCGHCPAGRGRGGRDHFRTGVEGRN